eukprot:GHVL01032822.1.p1 GENE.GHVL01032822.1~~GHVL01032822.1.p1  ORF type:complete len:382 (-),score=70.51 GHVL01032822.1:68-1213(-)
MGENKIYATICIFFIVVTWLSMAELVDEIESKFPNSYFLTYIAHSTYTIFIPIWYIIKKIYYNNDNFIGYFSWTYYFIASIPTSIIAFISGWLWYESLPLTSVSGNSAIYQSASCMVFMFSICILNEQIDIIKTTSVTICVTGVCFISFFPSKDKSIGNTNPSFIGYILCFISMILYALYEVLYKKWAVNDRDIYPLCNAIRFLGLVGLSTTIFCAPPLLIVDMLNIEKFSMPRGDAIIQVLILGILDSVFNILLLMAIALSSPLFASIGCLLVLPVSLISDQILHSYRMPGPALMGVGLILAGFCGFGFGEVVGPLGGTLGGGGIKNLEIEMSHNKRRFMRVDDDEEEISTSSSVDETPRLDETCPRVIGKSDSPTNLVF